MKSNHAIMNNRHMKAETDNRAMSSWICLPRPLSLFMVNRKENACLTRPLGCLSHHGCAE